MGQIGTDRNLRERIGASKDHHNQNQDHHVGHCLERRTNFEYSPWKKGTNESQIHSVFKVIEIVVIFCETI